MDQNSRRKFITQLVAGGTLTGLASVSHVLQAATPIDPTLVGDAEEWLKKGLKGKHKVAYDGPEPHDALPIIWTWAFYMTNNITGVDDKDLTGLCVFRHNAIPFAMNDSMWKKYAFGETFKINDNVAKAPATINPYFEPKEGAFPVPGIDGIKRLQERGALFCVCDLALTVYSGFTAQAMNLKAEDVKKEWVANLLPGVQIVPSGVWALGRAQDLGAGYIYAGG